MDTNTALWTEPKNRSTCALFVAVWQMIPARLHAAALCSVSTALTSGKQWEKKHVPNAEEISQEGISKTAGLTER